jgi:malonyl CoA-acyl carrier protein transacylase/NAD(P)-dependent dehydrogenase (short-subunit alcohol dehydrogenase family)/acyl-CoA thioesterase FadM
MGYFAWPYRVLFHDTMAYGGHHFLTNFKFQCEAREQFFYTCLLDSDEARAESDALVYLTQEGYSRNLAPVTVGDTVGILLSLEDVGASSVRCCIRVVRSDGTPVCCGFQTLVVMDRSGRIVPGPERFRRFGPALREKTATPSFSERVLAGTGLRHLFDAEAIRLGRAAAGGARSTPDAFARRLPDDALVLTFPGAGSFTSASLLAELAAAVPEAEPLLRRADEVAGDVLGAPLRPLLDPAAARDHGQRHPDLVQPAIYLASLLSARYLAGRGVRPDALVGHSLGELAALAVGGAMSEETGLVAVAHRARALRPAHEVGGMVVLFTPRRRTRALLESLGPSSLEVAVANLTEQTVVSGRHADLARLEALASHLAIAHTRLESNLPFHSRLLADCVEPFAQALRALPFRAPAVPVYSPIERAFYSADSDVPAILSSHLVRPLVFHEALGDLYELGARRFVECGGGRALTGIVAKALAPREVATAATGHPAGKVAESLARALETCGPAPRTAPAPEPVDLAAAALCLVDAPAAPAVPLPLAGRRVLVLCDQPSWLRSEAAHRLLAGFEHRLVVPAAEAEVAGAIALDLSSDEALARSAARLDESRYDAILAVADLGEPDALAPEARTTLVELMLGVARHAYARLATGEVPLAALCLRPWRTGEQLHPVTGLVGGFAKSLARELPGARIKVVHGDDADPRDALARLEGELGATEPQAPVEVAYRDGRRSTFGLVALDPVVVGRPLDPGAVVVATGGARGVTAVLVEALLESHGVTAVLLGRSDPAAVPADLAALDEAAFDAREPAFYEAELARGQARLPELKARWRAYRASREVAATLRSLSARGGHVRYVRCDVTDAAAVDSAIAAISREEGRIDLVLHGAGVQSSRVLSKRTLPELRAVLAAKLGGIAHLRSACARHLPGRPPHFHLLTSAAGYVGNPGQADYAAANEALNRLAGGLAATGTEGEWSTTAWLGWSGIGMARGSEYAAIAAATGQRWLSREEGKAFFSRLMSGRPVAVVNAPVRPSEAALFPGLALRAARGPLGQETQVELSAERHPFIGQHRLGDVPTAPGTFLLELTARAASSLRPGRRVVRVEEARFERFVKVGRPRTFSIVSRVLADDERQTVVQVRILSDFVHASGQVLQKDVEHTRTLIVLSADPAPLSLGRTGDALEEGIEVADPYQHPQAPIRLGGPFASLGPVLCRTRTTSAAYRLREVARGLDQTLTPVLLLDALFRMAAVRGTEPTVPILAPVFCGRLELAPDTGTSVASLLASKVRFEGDVGIVDWAEARGPDGRLVVRGEHLIGRRMGDVPRVQAAVAAVER